MRRFPVLRQVFAANTAVVVCRFLCRLLALPQRCNHIRNTRNSLYKAATTWNRRDKRANVGRYQANSLQITGRTDEPFFLPFLTLAPVLHLFLICYRPFLSTNRLPHTGSAAVAGSLAQHWGRRPYKTFQVN